MRQFLQKSTPPLLFTACAFLLLSAPVLAETLYIKKDGTKIHSEPSAKSSVVSTLGKGTSVESLGKEGKFYQISADGKKGWVFQFKVSKTAPPSDGGGLFGGLGGQKVSARESASGSSIRGLSPVSEEHAKKKGISESDIQAVKQMENFQVSSGEVNQFLQSRQLGEYSK